MSDRTLSIESVELAAVRTEGKLRAFATVNLNGDIEKINCKLVESSRGNLFVALPATEGKGKWYPVMDISTEFQKDLNEAVSAEYQKIIKSMPCAA
jgi:DNA-binding cell septation regulator SpoVG